MSQIDPTDHALAAIASMMEQPESSREPDAAASPEIQTDVSAQVLAEAPAPPPLPDAVAIVDETPLAPAAVEADGYSKVGPGPMAAIRFKWTVRRDHQGHFYVDETIGENSAPIVAGPMSADDAIAMVDAAEDDARQRFEQFRSEMMTGRASAASLVRNDGGEA